MSHLLIMSVSMFLVWGGTSFVVDVLTRRLRRPASLPVNAPKPPSGPAAFDLGHVPDAHTNAANFHSEGT